MLFLDCTNSQLLWGKTRTFFLKWVIFSTIDSINSPLFCRKKAKFVLFSRLISEMSSIFYTWSHKFAITLHHNQGRCQYGTRWPSLRGKISIFVEKNLFLLEFWTISLNFPAIFLWKNFDSPQNKRNYLSRETD